MSAPKWEYQHITTKHPASFSDLGEDGWELVGFSHWDTIGHAHFYFKRPVAMKVAAVVKHEGFIEERLVPDRKEKLGRKKWTP